MNGVKRTKVSVGRENYTLNAKSVDLKNEMRKMICVRDAENACEQNFPLPIIKSQRDFCCQHFSTRHQRRQTVNKREAAKLQQNWLLMTDTLD